jgi:hypothetical protein
LECKCQSGSGDCDLKKDGSTMPYGGVIIEAEEVVIIDN